MCKFICRIFSALSKTVSVTGKTIETGLTLTTSGLNEVNKGLNNLSNNLSNNLERKNKLYDIASKVYDGKLTKKQALQEVKTFFGSDAYLDFEYELNKFKRLEFKSAIYEIFPLGDENKQPKTREDIVNCLTIKYGYVDKQEFDNYVENKRLRIMDLLGGRFDYKIRSLSDLALYEEYKKKIIEIDEFMKVFDNSYLKNRT